MSDEQSGQSARTGCYRIGDVSAHAMSHVYDFVYRANLGLTNFTVNRKRERSNGLIVSFVPGKERNQNHVINNAAGVHERRAEYR